LRVEYLLLQLDILLCYNILTAPTAINDEMETDTDTEEYEDEYKNESGLKDTDGR
jgi:hypothetical protein